MSEPINVEVTYHIETPDSISQDHEISCTVVLEGFPPYQNGDTVHVKLTPDSEVKPFKVELIEHFIHTNLADESIKKLGMIVHLKEVSSKPRRFVFS